MSVSTLLLSSDMRRRHKMGRQKKASVRGTTDGCEPPCGCWELNSGPLKEQSGLLPADPSLQPLFNTFGTGRSDESLPQMSLTQQVWAVISHKNHLGPSFH